MIKQSPLHPLLSRSTDLIRYGGVRSGRTIITPTQYARCGSSIVIAVADPDSKAWWRNFSHPHDLDVLLAGEWTSMIGHVVRPEEQPGAAEPLIKAGRRLEVQVGILSSVYPGVSMPYGTGPNNARKERYARLNGTPVDWNGNGIKGDPGTVEQDVNFVSRLPPSPGQVLKGHDDWQHLLLGIGQGGDYADYTHDDIAPDEITAELADQLQQDLLGECPADLTGDEVLDLFDFLAFVNAFNEQDPVGDCVYDGVFDLFDFLCFVNRFNGGC